MKPHLSSVMRRSEGLDAWLALSTAPPRACPKAAQGCMAPAIAAPASMRRLVKLCFMCCPLLLLLLVFRQVPCMTLAGAGLLSKGPFAQQLLDAGLGNGQLADVVAQPGRKVGFDVFR